MTEHYYQIEIKQRGGKWVFWSMSDHRERIDQEWKRMPSVRRKARCVKVVGGIRTVLARYEPPAAMRGGKP